MNWVVGCPHLTDNCLLFPQDLLSFSLKDGKWISCLCEVGAGWHLCSPEYVVDKHRVILMGLISFLPHNPQVCPFLTSQHLGAT